MSSVSLPISANVCIVVFLVYYECQLERKVRKRVTGLPHRNINFAMHVKVWRLPE